MPPRCTAFRGCTAGRQKAGPNGPDCDGLTDRVKTSAVSFVSPATISGSDVANATHLPLPERSAASTRPATRQSNRSNHAVSRIVVWRRPMPLRSTSSQIFSPSIRSWLQQALLFSRVSGGSVGYCFGPGLAQLPGTERLSGGRELRQTLGRLQPRLRVPHRCARLVREEVRSAALTARVPHVGVLHPLGERRAPRGQHPLAFGHDLQERKRVVTTEASGLEPAEQSALRVDRRSQLGEDRHRFSHA